MIDMMSVLMDAESERVKSNGQVGFPRTDDVDTQRWTCGYRGLCRKHCFAQEYMVGYHGCPRRYRCCALRF
uniref:Beta-defensin n=1 Tax=Astyanax mexicanus TaxID=7994 RepID=A0A3B1JAS3_ASTMX